jgi:beta-mannanase
MDNIVENGCVPLVTWEPWVSEFYSEDLEPMPEREERYLRDIAAGKYDFHIVRWAKAAVAWGKPFFLRFAHEMTNPQYPWSQVNGNTSWDYKSAWWHVRAVFDSLGATNAIWVWCPYGTDVLEYYPGDEYVDWVAMDVFNYGEIIFGTDRRWMSFDELASPLYRELETLRKPIMVAEVGCSDIGGSREVWYREMLDQVRNKFTTIKAVVLFENPSDQTSGIREIDWSIRGNPDVLAEVRENLSRGYYRYIDDYLERLTEKRPSN